MLKNINWHNIINYTCLLLALNFLKHISYILGLHQHEFFWVILVCLTPNISKGTQQLDLGREDKMKSKKGNMEN